MTERIALQRFDISNKTAAVIGCGGLGCHVATHLSCAGIGRLLLCDFDTVSSSNLNRQFLYTTDEIGKKKVFLAQKKLSSISPATEISAFSKKIESPEDLSFALHTDILFLAVDNNTARSAVQSFCKTNHIPLVNGGVNGFFGTAYLYVPGKTADLSAAGLLTHENTASYSVTSTVGIIGALEAHLGIRYLINDTEDSGYLFVFDGGTVTRLPIKYSENQSKE